MKQKGFTLVELMVVVALIGIVASFAVPSFGKVIRDHQMRSTASDYYALIRYARAEAVRAGRPVTITPVTGTNWSTGIVAINQNNEVLREVLPRSGITVVEQGGVTALSFNGKGYLADTVEFRFCNGRLAEESRRINVLTSGFAAVRPVVGC